MLKVLVVDDSQMVRVQVKRALAGAGFQVVEATDGMDALEQLAKTPDTKLIVCDMNMPRMNGIEFLEAMQKNGGAAPVVMLTSEMEPELIRRAKAAGAVGWISKPFNPALLVATASKLTKAA